MADTKKHGFKTVETDYDELNKKISQRRKKRFLHVIEAIVILVILVVAVELIYELRNFDSYEVRSSVERNNGDAKNFADFNGYLLEYSNDGITCTGYDWLQIWNQSYEMSKPQISMCKEYLVVYDERGNVFYILSERGLEKKIETTSPIQTVCVAQNGTVAVLMREESDAQVKLFDKKGNELAAGKFYGSKGGFPIDIALSEDAQKLAVDMIDISQGEVQTTISFYNFGSVGQSEIDNNVGTYSYPGLFVPEIDYVTDNRLVAMGTGSLLIFEGAQKPELTHKIAIENEILSYFHNDKYIGIVYDGMESENLSHIKVMDMKGNTVMEHDISIAYDSIEFLSNNEICVTSENACELYTIHSIKKFAYNFDKRLYKILARKGGQNYTFIFQDTTEEVKLK